MQKLSSIGTSEKPKKMAGLVFMPQTLQFPVPSRDAEKALDL